MSDPLVDAIVANPDDDAPRLVWADREGGERGELVIIQCMLAKRDLPRSERHRLRKREEQLLEEHESRWVNLGPRVSGTFERGFVDEVSIDVRYLGRAAQGLFAHAPLVSALYVSGMNAVAQRGEAVADVWASMEAELASALSLVPPGTLRAFRAAPSVVDGGNYRSRDNAVGFGAELVKVLAAAPACSRLEELDLYGGDVNAPDLAPLTALKRVRLEGHRLEPGGAAQLLRVLPQLTRLALGEGDPDLEGDHLLRFLRAPEVARLTELEIEHGYVSNHGLEILAKANPPLRKLAILLIERPGRGLRNVLEGLAQLEDLSVEGGFDQAALEVLAKAPCASRLRHLTLRKPKLGADATPALLALPALESLSIFGRFPGSKKELAAVIPDVHIG